MKCPSCNVEISDNAKFCPECGEKIIRKSVCPECGTEVAPGAKFCAECGHKFCAVPAKSATPLAIDLVAAKVAVEQTFDIYYNRDGNCKGILKRNAQLVEQVANAGDARAMFLMGEIYADGCDGFAADPAKSTEWYRKSAGAGDPYGMGSYMAVLCGMKNKGSVEKDFKAAAEWESKAVAAYAVLGKTILAMGCLFSFEVAKAIDAAGEDSSPDFSNAAMPAEAILDAAMESDPATAPAVEKEIVGVAHFILATDAMSEKDFDAAREHLENGSAFGNADCSHYLAQMGEDDGDEEDDDEEEDDDADNGLIAKRGLSTRLPITSCRYSCRNGGNNFDITASFANTPAEDSGSLMLKLWFCGKEYAGGTLDGTEMCEVILDEPSLKSGYFYKDIAFMNLGRIGNPPTGDYRVVLTLNELNEDGNWYIVGWSNFPNLQYWTRPSTFFRPRGNPDDNPHRVDWWNE